MHKVVAFLFVCTLISYGCSAAPMPICNSEPHLITSSMNSNNITFVVAWSYSHTEGLHLSRLVLSYSIPIRGYLDQVFTKTISESLSISQTLKMITFSSKNVYSGTFIANVTVFNSQDSNTVMCPPLYLGKCKQATDVSHYSSYRAIHIIIYFPLLPPPIPLY